MYCVENRNITAGINLDGYSTVYAVHLCFFILFQTWPSRLEKVFKKSFTESNKTKLFSLHVF
jgi:hypothetical protein